MTDQQPGGWFKRHRIFSIFGGAILVLTTLDGVVGGFGAIKSVWERINPSKPPIYELQLVNVDATSGLRQGSKFTSGVDAVNLSAIFKNDQDATVYVIDDAIKGSLGGKSMEPENSSRRTISVAKGIAANFDAGTINVRVEKGNFADGRIDWRFKYGLDTKHLDREFRISGTIRLDLTHEKSRLVWSPDDDSAKPSGMKGILVPYDAETEDPMNVGSKLIPDK